MKNDYNDEMQIQELREQIESLTNKNRLLAASEAKYRSLFENKHEAVIILDGETKRFVEVNEAACNLHGYSKTEMLGFTPKDISAEIENTTDVLNRTLKQKSKQKVIERIHRKKNGELITLEVSNVAFEIEGKSYICSTFRDITEKKEFEKKLKEERDLSDNVINSSPNGVLIFNRDGIIVFANNTAFSIFNRDRETLIGMAYNDDRFQITELGGTPMEDESLPFRRVLETNGAVHNVEFSVSALSGKRKMLSVNAAPLLNPGEEIDRVVYTVNDISDQLSLHAQLIQAQKMESIGRLAGGVAHDFNNMLSAILGFADLLMADELANESQRSYLEQIKKAAARSAEIAKQLLGFARQQTIAPEIYDLNEIIDGMLNMLRRLIGENIFIHWTPDKFPQKIKIDPAQINQILANLCVNAKDAIPDIGTITISTGEQQFDDLFCRRNPGSLPGDYVYLELSDNGSGMSREILKHVFEPFYTTKAVGKGTGLGLAMVYGIVKQNKGYILVYSEEGIGTTFKLFFPKIFDGDVAVQKQADSEIHRGSGELILLVEDDEMILDLAETLLSDLGYRVISTGSPSKAVEMAHELSEVPSMLLTDMIMPEINGKALADKISARFPEIKVLFMSGYSANFIKDHNLYEENIAFLMKPFTRFDLAAKVYEVLKSD